MRTRRTDAAVKVVFTTGRKQTLYLVPLDKAVGLESLLDNYRADDFVPAADVFADLYSRYGQAGTAVRGFRVREGWSQTELARKLDCPQSWVSGWESGKRALGKGTAQKLAKVFGTDYRVFL